VCGKPQVCASPPSTRGKNRMPLMRAPMSTVEFGLLQKKLQHFFVRQEPFLRPGLCKHQAAARRSCQEWPLLSGHPQGLFLTAASTVRSMIGPGRCNTGAFGLVFSVVPPFAGELRFRDRMSSCQPRIRRDRPIPDHDPSIRERSCLRRVQSYITAPLRVLGILRRPPTLNGIEAGRKLFA